MIKYLALAAVLTPIFIGIVGGTNAGKESARLKEFCGRFPSGTDMGLFRTVAGSEGFALFEGTVVATESPESKIAGRLLENVVKSNWWPSGQIAAIVRKPGIGYYACLVGHDGKVLFKAEYIAND